MSITGTVVRRADIRFREAAPVLRPYVGCFWEITAERGAALRVVPDGSTSISLRVRAGSPPRWVLRGPLVEPADQRFTVPQTMVGVRLKPGVARLVSAIAAHRMVGRRLELRSIPTCRELATRIPATPAASECLDALERFLITRLENACVHDVVATAMEEIAHQNGGAGVADIARRCGVSARQLNRLMREWVGYGPKRFARIMRFQTTLEQMEHAPTRSIAALASEGGYFDQAHLTLDVVRLAGAPPRRLASSSAADFSKTYCDETL